MELGLKDEFTKIDVVCLMMASFLCILPYKETNGTPVIKALGRR